MKTEFKKGDTVYYGTSKGEVIEQRNENSISSMKVMFENFSHVLFTKDGRYYKDTPVVLSHFPYELEMKRVEEVIEKDTIVWYRDTEHCTWKNGYYSHFEDGKHYVFNWSLKSTETTETETLFWKIVTTKNPLI
jgi:hypothetical protein